MKERLLGKLIYSMGLASVVLAASGCSSMKLSKDRVAAVRRVAIVGFSLQQRMPNTGAGMLKVMEQGEGPGGVAMFPAEIAKPAPHAGEMYASLEGKLRDRLSWKILAGRDLSGLSSYKQLHAARTKQPQPRPMLSSRNMEVFVPDGIIEPFLLKTMSFEERRKLIQELGVDAIAMATIRVDLSNRGGLKKLVGAGEFHPHATLHFELFDGESEDPIWMDLNAKSEESAEGIEHGLGFASVEALNKQAVLVASDAIDKLIRRYRGE